MAIHVLKNQIHSSIRKVGKIRKKSKEPNNSLGREFNRPLFKPFTEWHLNVIILSYNKHRWKRKKWITIKKKEEKIKWISVYSHKVFSLEILGHTMPTKCTIFLNYLYPSWSIEIRKVSPHFQNLHCVTNNENSLSIHILILQQTSIFHSPLSESSSKTT